MTAASLTQRLEKVSTQLKEEKKVYETICVPEHSSNGFSNSKIVFSRLKQLLMFLKFNTN